MPPCPLRALDATRIALIKPSALGDIAHALPVLTALRARFPAARLTWVVNQVYEPLLRGHPDLDETLAFDRGAFRLGLLRGVRGVVDFWRELRRRRFDLAIDLQGLLRSGLMTAATGATRRVGLSPSREGARLFYTDQVVVPGPMHAVDRYWLVAEALGAGGVEKQFRLGVEEEDQRWAEQVLGKCSRPWLMLAVGSRWLTKRWPPRHFATLARRAQQTFGGTVVLVGTPDEKALSRAVGAALDRPSLDLTGGTTLAQLKGVLARADVVLANDTGPLHVAVALGRPVVAPYTCTKVELTGPYGQLSQAVATRVWCQGSCLRQCDRLECMDELTPDHLWPVLREVLQRWTSPLSA